MTRHTILLVDDDSSNLEALEDLLSEDYEILTASNGQEALEYIGCSSSDIQLIISDQRMPGMSGAEFLLHTRAALPHAKRILLTGYTDVSAIVDLVNQGQLYQFVLKPFDHNDVRATVKRAVEAFAMEAHNRQLVEELKQLNANLERKVEERTQQLQRTLGDLEAALTELRETTAAKDRIYSIIAHDLRNASQSFLYSTDAIIEFARSLESGVWSDNKERLMQVARNQSATAAELSTLLENLLEWGRVQQGHFEYHVSECRLSELIDHSIALHADHAMRKGIAIERFEPEPEALVHADPRAIKTVLRNLLSNAVKFTHTGGEIQVRVTLEPERWQVTVRDNGVGIAAQDIERLLDFGHTHTREGTDHERGTGLGLPLCKELLTLGRGELHVTSRPGEGTDVRFSLPRNPATGELNAARKMVFRDDLGRSASEERGP